MLKYVVVNENTLGIIRAETPNTLEVLFGSVIKGGYDWKNGPVPISPSDDIRPATKSDFDNFRVCSKYHIDQKRVSKQ